MHQLSTLGHDTRLALFRLLLRRFPDQVPAGEIAGALGIPANTASHHLSDLMAAGLIRRERRGTSRLYSADMEGIRAMNQALMGDCCLGRPDLCPPAAPVQAPATTDRRYRVLFLCSGNSARSIFAEAILRHEAGDRFVACSAGTDPAAEPNPLALRLLADKGYDTAPLRAKDAAEFRGAGAQPMDFVFTVCDRAANEACPAWPGQPVSAHWGLPDPARAEGSEAERLLAFQQCFGQLRNRIRAFVALPLDTLDRLSIQYALDEIAGLSDTSPA